MHFIKQVFDARKEARKNFKLMKDRLTFDPTIDTVEDVLVLMSVTSILEEFSFFAKLYRYSSKFSAIKKSSMYQYIYYISMGSYSRTTHDYQTAIMYFASANKLAIGFGDGHVIAQTEIFICSIYHRLLDYEMAAYYALKAIEAIDPTEDDLLTANAYNTYGVILVNKKEYQEALHYYHLSEEYYQKQLNYEEQPNYATLMLNIFEAYLALGMQKKAEYYLNIGNEIVRKHDFYYLISELLIIIADYYQSIGDFENAYLYLNKYIKKNHKLMKPKFTLGKEMKNHGIKNELKEISLLKEKNKMLLTRLKSFYVKQNNHEKNHIQIIEELDRLHLIGQIS